LDTKPALPRPNVFLLVTMLVWAYNFSAVKLMSKEASAPSMVLARSVLMMGIIVVVGWYSGAYRLKLSLKQRWMLWAQGLLSNGLYMIAFLYGMRGTTAAMGAIILATVPLQVALLSVFLKHSKVEKNLFVGAGIAFAGVILAEISLASSSTGVTWWGNALVFLGAICWAVAVILMRPLSEAIGPIPAFVHSFPAAFLVLIPLGLTDLLRVDFASWTLSETLNFFHFSLLSGGLGFFTYYKGLSQVGTVKGVMYQFIVAPMAGVMAWMALGTPLTPGLVGGLLLVLSGVYWALFAKRPQASNQ